MKKNENDILETTAIVLANLCVAYIMTSQNEEAEELMKKIEKEEERIAFADPEKQCFHLCIVNLVIGTLYCAKGNFEFGISRICKSLEVSERSEDEHSSHYFTNIILFHSIRIRLARSCSRTRGNSDLTLGSTQSGASWLWPRTWRNKCSR